MKNELLIATPDILPNNLRDIRKMRGKSISETCEAAELNPSYMSFIETHNINMSGSSAILLMNYLDVSFYQMFGNKEPVKAPFSIESVKTKIVNLILDNDLLNSENHYLVEQQISQHLPKNDKDNIKSFKIIESNLIKEQNRSNVKLEIEIVNKETIEKDFDINFVNDMDNDLFQILLDKGFKELEYIDYNHDEYTISDNKIYLSNKEPNNIAENTVVIDLDDILANENIEIIYDRDTDKKIIRINNKVETLYNIEFIRSHLKMTKSHVIQSLGLSRAGYSKIINGKQSISTKHMWRLVKLFKVPLECIINIPLYIETIIKK